MEPINRFVDVLIKFHFVEKPYSASRYAFVSPFDMLKRAIFTGIRNKLSKEETISLAVDRTIADIERSRRKPFNRNDIEELRKGILPLAEYLYDLAFIKAAGSFARLVQLTNHIRDYIYVEVKLGKIKKIEEAKKDKGGSM